MINIEVIFFDHVGQMFQKEVQLEVGATVYQALQASCIQSICPDILSYPVGIFSKPATLETVLTAGDRIEIYRPLQCDPKTRRRLRAKK